MKTILLLHLLPFLHSAPEPDPHLHVYLPQESGQGKSFLVASFSSVSSKGENSTPVEGLFMVEGLLMVERLEGLEGLDGLMVERVEGLEGLLMLEGRLEQIMN